MSSPAMRTTPEVGAVKPPMMFNVVVLPHPEGPSRQKNSPSRISRSRGCNATMSAKVLVTPRSSMALPRLLVSATAAGVERSSSTGKLVNAHRPSGASARLDRLDKRNHAIAVGKSGKRDVGTADRRVDIAEQIAERIAEALGMAGGCERQACGGGSQCVGIAGDGGH